MTLATPGHEPTSFVQQIGAHTLAAMQEIGSFNLFTALALSHCLRPPFYPWQTLRQMLIIGYNSLPVVGMTALFTGMVLALQSAVGLSRLNAEGAVATIVVLSMTRELGPVLGGLMVAGRVSSAIAAEIGTMRVTEQIDALVTLSTNPIKYLVVPRLIAGVITLPILVLVADIIGVFGGFLIGVYTLDFNAATYLKSTTQYLEVEDVVSGLIKAAAFGFILTIQGCYFGFHSGRGAQGVGAATTNAVVAASVVILIANYVLTELFFA